MNTANKQRPRAREFMGLAAGAGVVMSVVTLVVVSVVALMPPASAHKEHHEADELAIFKELFMEQVIIGDRLFHGDGALEEEMGVNLSNTGMACAMCHPFGRDTNPHEFPKFQEQMSEFATLRDMTNWCIENPNEGELIDPESPAMKALEAYQLWSHTGSVLNPGEH
jgi:thiosulfate dehydrogenase